MNAAELFRSAMNRSALLVSSVAFSTFFFAQGCGQDRIYMIPEPPDAGPPPICVVGDVQDCSTGLKGVCEAGKSTCVESGELVVSWSPCVGVTASSAEVCDGLDNDCDGISDEGGLCSTPPAVTCPPDRTVNANSTVALLTTATDAEGDTFTCEWDVASRPATSAGNFSAPTNCRQTNYFADVVGAHNVRFTATDSNGQKSTCATTITVLPVGDLWIELTWDKPNDMDLHLQHPNAGNSHSPLAWSPVNGPTDCFFAEKNPSWDAAGTADDPSLDRDDEVMTGPENIRINSPVVGQKYTIGVHNYAYNAAPSAVNATVKVYCAGSLVATKTRAFTMEGDMWVMGTIEYRGNDCAFTPDGYSLFVAPF